MLTLLRVSTDPLLKGSVPQGCLHFRCQLQVSNHSYFWPTSYKSRVPTTSSSGLNPVCSSTQKVLLSITVTKYDLWTLPTSKDPVLSGGVSAFPGLQQLISCTIESKSYHLFELLFCLLPNRVLTPPIQGTLWRTNVKVPNILSNRANVKDYYCQYYDFSIYHGKHLEIRKTLTGIMPLISETKTAYLMNLKYLINSRLRKMMLPS